MKRYILLNTLLLSFVLVTSCSSIKDETVKGDTITPILEDKSVIPSNAEDLIENIKSFNQKKYKVRMLESDILEFKDLSTNGYVVFKVEYSTPYECFTFEPYESGEEPYIFYCYEYEESTDIIQAIFNKVDEHFRQGKINVEYYIDENGEFKVSY